jgi:hypothetical protein
LFVVLLVTRSAPGNSRRHMLTAANAGYAPAFAAVLSYGRWPRASIAVLAVQCRLAALNTICNAQIIERDSWITAVYTITDALVLQSCSCVKHSTSEGAKC